MTDKLQDVVELPEWQEQWIEANAGNAADWMTDVDVISVSTLRAFLAQYVLCEREPVAYSVAGSKIFKDRAVSGLAVAETVLAERKSGTIIPLHAPAKEPGQ